MKPDRSRPLTAKKPGRMMADDRPGIKRKRFRMGGR
jgi:hypothetical protein